MDAELLPQPALVSSRFQLGDERAQVGNLVARDAFRVAARVFERNVAVETVGTQDAQERFKVHVPLAQESKVSPATLPVVGVQVRDVRSEARGAFQRV